MAYRFGSGSSGEGEGSDRSTTRWLEENCDSVHPDTNHLSIDSLFCSPIISSLGAHMDNKAALNGWVKCRVPHICEEFASLPRKHTDPLYVRFYVDKGGENCLAQIGEYSNVRPDEATKCLVEQPSLLGSHYLYIQIDVEKAAHLVSVKSSLYQLLTRNEFSLPLGHSLHRLQFSMHNFIDYSLLKSVLKKFCSNLNELSIGIAKVIVKRNNPSEEADSVMDLMQEWIMETDMCKTLKILRIYQYIKLCPRLEQLVNGCPLLEHLTISKITDARHPIVFKEIRSFEFAGLNLAHTFTDVEFTKKILSYFPSLRVVAYLDVTWEPIIASLLKGLYNSCSQNKDSGRRLALYQSLPDLEKFAANTKSLFVVRSARDMPVSMEMQHLRGFLQLTVFRGSERYFLPSFS